MTDDSDMKITSSSGNVFVDLDLADADDFLAKANLAIHIKGAIKTRKLTQAQAAKILCIDLSKVSSIFNGRLEGYSIDSLKRGIQQK